MDLMARPITHICKNDKTAESNVIPTIMLQESFFLFSNNQNQNFQLLNEQKDNEANLL